jgi:F0F1-type ATP synthase gamma subunit
MIDLLVTLWDSRQGAFKKVTKGSGVDHVENPWINMIACTTPSWIAGNFPDYVIGGGFTSRCLFVYTEEKEKFVAYPSLSVPLDQKETATALVQDLEHIATLAGPYKLSADAILEQLLSLYVRNQIYRALVETAAGFYGAQRTAMKNATDNAGDMLDLLRRTYNRARQAQITQELAEIVGGAEALKGS